MGEFDEAITSRVHCALYYPPFNKSRTMEVWRKNIEKLQRQKEISGAPVECNKKEIMKFARQHWKAGNRWNGRQIKNAFQTAVALADWDNLKENPNSQASPRLKLNHFDTVAAASAHFDRYLTEVRNSDDQRASLGFLRRDDVTKEIADYFMREQTSRAKKTPVLPQWPSMSALFEDNSNHVGTYDSDSDSDGHSSSGSDSDSDSNSEEGDSEYEKQKQKEKEKEKEKEKKMKKKAHFSKMKSDQGRPLFDEKKSKKTKHKEKSKSKTASKSKSKRSSSSKKSKQDSSQSSSSSQTESESD